MSLFLPFLCPYLVLIFFIIKLYEGCYLKCKLSRPYGGEIVTKAKSFCNYLDIKALKVGGEVIMFERGVL